MKSNLSVNTLAAEISHHIENSALAERNALLLIAALILDDYFYEMDTLESLTKEMVITNDSLRKSLHYDIPISTWKNSIEKNSTEERKEMFLMLLQSFSNEDLDASSIKGFLSYISSSIDKNIDTYTISTFFADLFYNIVNILFTNKVWRTLINIPPNNIVQLMVKISQLKQANEIYDPICGIGSFLAEYSKQLSSVSDNTKEVAIFGQEIDPYLYILNKVHMVLRGSPSKNIHLVSSIKNSFSFLLSQNKPRKFDAIISSFPMANRKLTRSNQNNYLYHIIRSLKPKTGHAVVLTTETVLFDNYADARNIREKLINDNILDSVVLLPRGIIERGIRSVILYIRYDKNNDSKSITFINLSDQELVNGRVRDINEEHSKLILNAIITHTETAYISKNVSIDEIKSNDFNLGIRQYVDSNISKQQHDSIQKLKDNARSLQDELIILGVKEDEHLKRLGIKY